MLIKLKFLYNNKSSDISFPSFMKYFLPTAINIKYKQNFYTHIFPSFILINFAFQEMDISCSGTSTWIFEYNVTQRVSLADGTPHNNIMQNLIRNTYFMNNFNTIKDTFSPVSVWLGNISLKIAKSRCWCHPHFCLGHWTQLAH